MNTRLIAITVAVLFTASATYARVGDTQAQVETQYGKHVKTVKAMPPATSAFVYQHGDLGIFVGFVDGKSAYELVETVEDDGDFGEDKVSEKDIAASLKANADGEWIESKDTKKKHRTWHSADGKLIATYDGRNYQLLIESAEFAAQRAAKK